MSAVGIARGAGAARTSAPGGHSVSSHPYCRNDGGTPRTQSVHPFFLELMDEVRKSRQETVKLREEIKPDLHRALHKISKLEENYQKLLKLVEDQQQKSFTIQGSTYQVHHFHVVW